MKKLKLYIVALSIIGGLGALSIAAPSVHAAYDPLKNTCQSNRTDASGTNKPEESTVCQDKKSTSNPITGKNGIILKISTIIAVIAGIVAVIMIIVGGAGMIMSGGDAGAVKTARSRIIHALIGLIIIVLAQGIVSIVIGRILT